jgi:sterol desaturase/sphingolipid hydroxylase (fatty acid hydroxylase superfamily)
MRALYGLMTLPIILLILSTTIFLVAERVFPGRSLPKSVGWYLRCLSINFVQFAITFFLGDLWYSWFSNSSVFQLSKLDISSIEGFIGWFVGTFVFYWWHRLRHKKGFWLVFHQIHHSASRIEVLTSFYKHPIEILVNSFLTSIILFPILGVSVVAALWYNFFAATGEYFYHANIKSPKWLRYFIQTPELHSIHHQYDVHRYNFSDIPIWDRMFGTYKDTTEFTSRCGFPAGAEQRIGEMLVFKDVYEKTA